MKIIEQSAKLLSPKTSLQAVEALKAIEYAGRNCYNSQDNITENSYAPFISGLIKRGHASPLEFCNIMLELVTSRDVMAEWTRHRLVSNSIRSQRYVNESKDGGVEFIRPQFTVAKNGDGETENWVDIVNTWEDACRASENYYMNMLNCGAKKEDARKVLNNSVATKIITCINARELRHILQLRISNFAYPEMRWLANLILRQVRSIPVLFDDIDYTMVQFDEERENNI